jgi:hypothetical protein
MKNKFWLGTFKTEEAAARAFRAADDWRATHSGSNSFTKEELDDLKERAKKAGDHLSDDRSHRNVAAPDLVENLEAKATTLASLEGKEVASKEHVSQRESPAHENFSSEEQVSQRESPAHENFSSEEHVSQRESPAHENFSSEEHVSQRDSPAHENFFPEFDILCPDLDFGNCFLP